MKTVIQTPKAPAAIGPYSQAIAVGDMIYTSGMIPIIQKRASLRQAMLRHRRSRQSET